MGKAADGSDLFSSIRCTAAARAVVRCQNKQWFITTSSQDHDGSKTTVVKTEIQMAKLSQANIQSAALTGADLADTKLSGAAIFLASPASNFVTGHILYVDGGVTSCL